jgi:hypothetical protein
VKSGRGAPRLHSEWIAVSVSSAVMSFEHERLALNVADTDGARTDMALSDILRIPGGCEARIVPLAILSNAKSRAACTAGGQNAN